MSSQPEKAVTNIKMVKVDRREEFIRKLANRVKTEAAEALRSMPPHDLGVLIAEMELGNVDFTSVFGKIVRKAQDPGVSPAEAVDEAQRRIDR